MTAINAIALGTTTGTTGTRPRSRLVVNGSVPVGSQLVSHRMTHSRYGRGDTFSAEIALSPNAAPWFDPAADANGEIAPVDVQIQMGFLADGAPEGSCSWATMFQGILDTVGPYQPHRALLAISGRDYLSKLRDLAVQEAWLNHTGAEILTLLIQAAGLTADVQLPSGIDGQFYQVEHKRLALIGSHRFSSAFDLARFLVNSASCDMWSEGKTVKVRARDADSTSTTLTYVPSGSQAFAQGPFLDMSLERDLLIGRGVAVQVSSWDSKQRKSHVWYFSGKGASRTAPPTANASIYPYSPSGLSDDKAKAFAQARYLEIVAHARKSSITMPGELALTPRQNVQLLGTGTSWDTSPPYGIDQIEREFSLDAGFRQTLTLRNRQMPTDDGNEG